MSLKNPSDCSLPREYEFEEDDAAEDTPGRINASAGDVVCCDDDEEIAIIHMCIIHRNIAATIAGRTAPFMIVYYL